MTGQSGGPPRPSKIICVGRNYTAHAAELGHEVPGEPLIFFKPPSAIVRDGDPIRVPGGVGRVDYEGEIAVILGRRASALAEGEGWSHVGWVMPMNDVTARDLQKADSQWTRAKGFDTFCPMGVPVPVDGIDWGALEVVTRVNGEERQRGSTSELAFPIPFLVEWISRIMTLEPGDVISTGTPEGVGPLGPGDVVRVEVTGVGAIENPVRPG